MAAPPVPNQPAAETATAPAAPSSNPVANSSTQTPPASSPPPPIYLYEYLTDDLVTDWKNAGRATVIESGIVARKDDDKLALGSIFQEIIRSGLDGRIEPMDAGSAVRDILGSQDLAEETLQPATECDATTLFLDCLSIITEGDISNPALLRTLTLSTEISPSVMREQLEGALLEVLGLIRSTFSRVRIRHQTNILYRQANYNLLREETEGYSKLVTELFTASAASEDLSPADIEETIERVKAMIGTFDLDVGRVLDVTLDVFASVLVKQFRFFVKYLRSSSWWPQDSAFKPTSKPDASINGLPKWALPNVSGNSSLSEEERMESLEARNARDVAFWDRVREVGMTAYFEIGGGRIDDSLVEATTLQHIGDDTLLFNEDRKWIGSTKTLPPSGNTDAAQILGFKLQFYSSPARDASDTLPHNLIYLAALLIKIGFISLKDLYPHLWPADDAMGAVKEEKMKEKAERERLNRPGGGTMNALMAAGALSDDTLPAMGRLREADHSRGLPSKTDSEAEKVSTVATPAPATEAQETLPPPADQKVQLLKSLLCIGAIPEALYILGRFPWLPEAFPELPDYIHRILHHCLNKVYQPLRPLVDHPEFQLQHKIVDPDQSGLAKGQLRRMEPPVRKPLRWPQPDTKETDGTIYRFYWDEWTDSIPVCQSVDDVFSLCGTLLNFTGVKIGQDPSLLMKLARIGHHSLSHDSSETNKARWIDLSKRLLVPALSLTKSNPGVVNEVFELIKFFSTTVRYSIYAEWYTGAISRLPDIRSAFDQVRAETKDVLKRISKTNLKPMAKSLAKVATASPGIVFTVAIGQIESYDNLVEVVVECTRYFTYLGYDVLTWSLMSSLGARGRDRVQADGMLTSKWLSALSLFAGKAFKRYSVMNPTPILQYVTEQLRLGNSTDLIVLEEITTSMAGIVSDTNFNDAQVQCMAGGRLLQAQTMLQLLDKRHESSTSAKRLMRSLVDPKLAGQLLISIAQERQTCVFKIPESDAHLKLLGNLFDEIHRVLTQYLDLLRSNLSVKEFDSLIPDVSRLISEFGIEPSVAFWISRPSIARHIEEYDAKAVERSLEKKPPPPATNEDVTMEDSADTHEDPSPVKESNELLNVPPKSSQELAETAPAPDTSQSAEMARTPTAHSDEVDQPWHPVLRPLIERICPPIPPETWEVLSKPFYVAFWQLSIGDLIVPTINYEEEINRQKKKITLINSDRSDISVAGTQKKDREKKALTELQDRLRQELKDRVSSYSQTRSRLVKEKDHWFSECSGKNEIERRNVALLEHCFFPRLVLSPVDSHYTFKMIKLLHSAGAKNFRTMGLFDQLFNGKRLTSIIFLCTAKEADSFGRFLNDVLKELGRWHADKMLFEKEAYGSRKDLPGFCWKMAEHKFLEYEDFRRILQKWHHNLHTALKACFVGGEYMHIRNAVIILKAVVLHFPAINWMGQAQVSSITELTKTESREDLKIAATSLLGNLRRREKEWVMPQAFFLVYDSGRCNC